MELPGHPLKIEKRSSFRDSTRNSDDQDDQNGHLEEEDETGAIRNDQQSLRSKSFPMSGGWLEAEGPPELKPNHGRCIVHFDIDCFYAQVYNQKCRHHTEQTLHTLQTTFNHPQRIRTQIVITCTQHHECSEVRGPHTHYFPRPSDSCVVSRRFHILKWKPAITSGDSNCFRFSYSV